jgi:hypothetical protein
LKQERGFPAWFHPFLPLGCLVTNNHDYIWYSAHFIIAYGTRYISSLAGWTSQYHVWCFSNAPQQQKNALSNHLQGFKNYLWSLWRALHGNPVHRHIWAREKRKPRVQPITLKTPRTKQLMSSLKKPNTWCRIDLQRCIPQPDEQQGIKIITNKNRRSYSNKDSNKLRVY